MIYREDQTKTDMKKRDILQAALSFVPQHGWTRRSLILGSSSFVVELCFRWICICCTQVGESTVGPCL